ncbi:tRNA (adenosine(37)-N6)-dimethylallyltransferase MiaA [Acidipila sp. EB88]|uniref:tRNA (adenosine(37)-N6)-dimethylallyltransferase MiaA n=1 Tax=Acidipila sp. EB88 TaxID=2305226 RepID=UPI000F5E183F|nr:tRNA (adenosine(37)-N6)-dimethylallyltransferase MiaA [Acidipila sp. EB88]RRA48319.1 tRNA (adenosine(37)-N6)-dimethylallyltransferase MiaA [Acidipila sp. EB88]
MVPHTLFGTSTPLPLLVILLGPTGSGKTALSLLLAQRFGGEVLSCDSVAVYRGMEIGTAKPSAAERSAVPHHLLDLVDPDGTMTAGHWARAAREAAEAVAARGRLPIVSGGTGLYLRALTEGLAPLPPRCPALRARLAASAASKPPGYLHRILKRVDAPSAARIHPNDTPKLSRAIEVAMVGPAPISAAGRSPLEGFRLLRIGLNPPRPSLYQRLNERAAHMFASGLLEETRTLQRRYGADTPALQSLGYREAAAVLAGQLSEQAAIAAAQQGHRNYSKRQLTWFRREPSVHWFQGFGHDPEIAAGAIALVESMQATPPVPGTGDPAS